MENDSPLVSVIIPVYNAERFVAAAIESVLYQSYRPLDVIIIDDGSTDGSAAIAKNYPTLRYIYQPNAGLSAALNKGVAEAQGNYFAFLDADDLWMENKLALQMSMFEKHPDLDIVFGHHQRFYSSDVNPDQTNGAETEEEILPAFLKGAMLIKRDSFFRVGLFDTTLRVGDFLDWYKRASEIKLKSLMMPDVVLKRRIHDDHLSVRNQHATKDYVRIIKASLDRQRKKDS
ncbi:MAG: hypothetical protein A2031_00190, partial [Deltaproteobacteria bacterium RBG_19FT_COMBO_43_11]